MNAWRTVLLGEVAAIERSSVQPEQIKAGTIYVGLEHIESGGVFLDPKPVDAGALASSKFYFTANHVLYGKLRPYLAKIACPEFGGICSTDIVPILPGPKIERRYLFHFLRQPSMVDYASSRAVGVNLPRLSPSMLEGFRIPLPPVVEQRRIADVLDRAEALRAKRRSALVQLNTLTQAIFLDLFGPPGCNLGGVREVLFTTGPLEIIDGDRGNAYPKSEEFSSSGYCLFLTAKNVTARGFEFSECQFIAAGRDEALGKGKLQRGDVVLTTRGTLGNAAYYDGSILFAHVRINSGMLVLRANESELRPKFLYIFLGSPHFIQQIERVKSGSAQPQLPIRTLSTMRLLLPSVALQDRCIQVFDRIKRHQTKLEDSARGLDSLFGSLQHRAFQGEL